MIQNKSFQNIKDKITDVVKRIKENPIDNLCLILPKLAVATSIVGFVIALIIYIAQGGYGTQINLIKSTGIMSSFSRGTTSIIYGNIIGLTVKVFLTLNLILLMVALFKQSSKVKKAIMIVNFLLIGIICVSAFVINAILFRKIALSGDQEAQIIDFMNGLNSQSIEIFQIIILVLCVLIGVSFLIMILTSKCRWVGGHICVAGIVSFGIVPLVLVIIENIVPLFILIIFCAILFFIFTIMTESSSAIGSMAISNIPGIQSNDKGANSNKEKKEEKPKIVKLDGDVQLWVEEPLLGGKVIKVYRKGLIDKKHEHVSNLMTEECLSDFKAGKVVYTINGRKATINDLHYR